MILVLPLYDAAPAHLITGETGDPSNAGFGKNSRPD
jgi:hypothetical protein